VIRSFPACSTKPKKLKSWYSFFSSNKQESRLSVARLRVAKLGRSVHESLSHDETDVNPEKVGYHLTGRSLTDKSGSEKILVVESDDSLRESIVTVLSDAGYEVSTDYGEGMKSVVTFNPDGMILVDCPSDNESMFRPSNGV